jgi:hypothetical protein
MPSTTSVAPPKNAKEWHNPSFRPEDINALILGVGELQAPLYVRPEMIWTNHGMPPFLVFPRCRPIQPLERWIFGGLPADAD